jgi:outer membrane protein OmpA-like peptidoglycan-associated protein
VKQEASAVGATAPAPIEPAHAREKLAQAEAAMRINDDQRVRYLLEQAEAAAWLAEARDRNRLLLEIHARRAEFAEKRAREARALSESSQQATRAAASPTAQLEPSADQLATRPPAQDTKPLLPDRAVALGDVSFDAGSAVLRAEATATIDRLGEFLRANTQRKLLIEGFSDSAGSDKYNLSLSNRRAMAVRQALLKRGVASERIRVRGYGAAYPVASKGNEVGRQQNRRVEIVISDVEGRITGTRVISSKSGAPMVGSAASAR